jgi:hypothetical protein
MEHTGSIRVCEYVTFSTCIHDVERSSECGLVFVPLVALAAFPLASVASSSRAPDGRVPSTFVSGKSMVVCGLGVLCTLPI